MNYPIQKSYVGNCVNSFSEDGECINPYLPFSDVSDFAVKLEDAKQITRGKFFNNVCDSFFNNVCDSEFDCEPVYMVIADGDTFLFIAYNPETDIHFFFGG